MAMATHLQHLKEARTKAKVVDDPLLNRAGLQVARTVAARASQLRMRPTLDPGVTPYVERFRRDGLVTVPDLLTTDELATLRDHARRLLDDPSVPRHEWDMGRNTLVSIREDELTAEQISPLDVLLDRPLVWELIAMAGRRRVDRSSAVVTVDRLVQSEGDASRDDPQTAWHSDTFFSTVKCWLYLTDVRAEDGPLEYVPGSQRLSARELVEVYRHSCRHGVDPSRRIPDGELHRRGLPAPTALECPAGTFVVADTFGYHRRRLGRPGGVREAIHIQARANPFHR